MMIELTPVRRNEQCPFCREHAATFVAKSSNGALYRCNNLKRRMACGRWFELDHPKPLPKTQIIEIREAA